MTLVQGLSINLAHMAVPATTLIVPANVKIATPVLWIALLAPTLFTELVIMVKENMLLYHITNAVGLVLIATLAPMPTDKVVLVIIKNVHIVTNADAYPV